MLKNIENRLELSSTSRKDLLYVFISIILLTLISVQIDLFDLMIDFTREHEDWELDEYILAVFVSIIPILWYSYRRYEEIYKIKKEIENINKDLEIKLKNEIEKNHKLLIDKNNKLEEKVTSSIEKIRKKDEILNQQSKMVAMGEMIESIAHQWKQPLSVISTSVSAIQLNKELKILDDEMLDKNNEMVLKNVRYLSKTIDDFKNFFSTNKKNQGFDIKDIYATSFTLICSTFKDIRFIENTRSIKITGLSNELIQVFINILNNARDEIKRKNLKGLIFITFYEDEDNVNIKIKDNAGGIAKNIEDKIFESHFSTKSEKEGSGIGLYMCKRIINQSFKGNIKVKNVEFEFENNSYLGAEFTISIPLIKRGNND